MNPTTTSSFSDDRKALIGRHRSAILDEPRIPTKRGFVDADDASIAQLREAAILHKKLAELHMEAVPKLNQLVEEKRRSRRRQGALQSA